ncbi:hypothetical protein NGRA_3494, partial [Nosema granulosis]
MKFKKLRRKELEEIIESARKKQIDKCCYCGSKLKETKRRVDEVVCTWKGCKKRYNLWKGSIFYHSQIKKKKILQIIELWMQKASINLISYILRINKKAIKKL